MTKEPHMSDSVTLLCSEGLPKNGTKAINASSNSYESSPYPKCEALNIQGSANCATCHMGKHGKDGKHQPDDIKHFINDSKHYIHDSKYSICQEDGSKTIFTLRHLWRRLNMGEHDPESG